MLRSGEPISSSLRPSPRCPARAPGSKHPKLQRLAYVVCASSFIATPAAAVSPESTAVSQLEAARPSYGYWSEGDPRWFLATKSDLGTGYIKPYVSAGYGLPHWIWAGVDLSSITTFEFTQVYAGVRAASPVLDLAFGVRDTWSFEKPFLAPKSSYRAADLLGPPGSSARYWAWEGEAVGILPLPHFALLGDFIVVRTLDVPSGLFVYDESYRAIVKNKLFMALRAAPVALFLKDNALKLGVLGELLFETGRQGNVTRLGPVAALSLTDHLEAVAGVTMVVSSPDSLGFALGTYGTACLRYRWATGEKKPTLPWRGEWIP